MAFAANYKHYLESLGCELNAQADRVRNLIGNAHWLTDGHHKEYLLLAVLNRHLPSACIASRGFVIDTSTKSEASKEQDILIVDTSADAPLFDQGGVIVATAHQVIASVSVKSTLTKANVKDAVKGLASLSRMCAGANSGREIWLGAYFYSPNKAAERDPHIVYDYIRGCEELREPPEKTLSSPLDMLCTNNDLIFTIKNPTEPGDDSAWNPMAYGYSCDGLSTSIFLAELLDHVADSRSSSNSSLRSLALEEDVQPLATAKCTLVT